jgi:hypothetical protein
MSCLNLGLMKIRLVSASGLFFFCFQQTHLSSPSLPTGRQAQEGVFRCNLNNEFLPERKDVVKGDPSHSPGEEPSLERKGSTIHICGESGSGLTTFLRGN